MSNYVQKSLKENEKIIGKAEINPIIRFPKTIMIFLGIWYAYIFPYSGSEVWLLINITIVICFIYDAIKTTITLDTTELCYTNSRIIGKNGWINTKSLDAPLNKINDISIKKGLLGSIFNYSTIIISTSSNKYEYNYLKDAEKFKNGLVDYIDKKNEDSKTINGKIENNSKYDDLVKLKELLDSNVISQEEFDKEKAKILQ